MTLKEWLNEKAQTRLEVIYVVSLAAVLGLLVGVLY